jgi:hypothetical protein
MGRFIFDYAKALNVFPVELSRTDRQGNTHAVALFKNPRHLWQLSYFDEDGASGHEENEDRPDELLGAAWQSGYRAFTPGVVDAMSENFKLRGWR